MHLSLYLRLTVLTAGTLLPFFWIVVILGHRRKRNFERIFFYLCLALVFFFGGSLLALNAQLFYPQIPTGLERFAWVVVCLGLWSLPSLLMHLHAEYADIRGQLRTALQKAGWIVAAYVPALFLTPALSAAMRLRQSFDFVLPSNSLGVAFWIWLVIALLVCAGWQRRFKRTAPDEEQRKFHRGLQWDFVAMVMWVILWHAINKRWPGDENSTFLTYGLQMAILALGPLVDLIGNVQKYNFLQIGRQRNLMYAVFAAFLALLYLSLIRRVSQWGEPYFPPEATAALMLFLPVVFFEPLQRLVGRVLRRTAQKEMDEAHRMMGPIVEVARLGSLSKLRVFVEQWVAERMQLEKVELVLDGETTALPGEGEDVFPVWSAGRRAGVLKVKPYGAMLSGETEAALEYICEQLPGALDLCRLIEEKLQLERELAERERLAVLGQMAASISHNLKNPLGSIKTILQVQLESPDLPDAMRAETRMVLEEISRLATKLNQLLQFSRPAVRGGAVAATCDANVIAEQVGGVLRHEADRRGVALEVAVRAESANLAASAEAVSEILSNLVVNALEATPRGGHVNVTGSANGEGYLLAVEDDGPGVPGTVQEKILQPFFTTKTQGTGLGLAIVAKRVADFGGRLEWKSPAHNGKGTRFEVTLPIETQAQ